METFATFICRHRFKLRDLFPSPANGAPRQHFELAKSFPQNQHFRWIVGGKGDVELKQAFIIAEYMSECAMDEPDAFSHYVSMLSDDAWKFALKFTPYHKVNIALENLDVVRTAMFEAVLALNAAKAGMESASDISHLSRDIYGREQSKATTSLLNFSALYASYIDVCRRIRKYARQSNDSAYQHAISRMISKNSGAHGFVKGFRNFILHHHLLQPQIVISYGDTKSVLLYLDANALLYSGFKWTVEARSYIQRSIKLDVLEAVRVVSADVDRLIRFHTKMVEKRLRLEKQAFDTYVYERRRFEHLQRSVVDINAAFQKRPTPMISRLFRTSVIDELLDSLLSDDEVKMVMLALADKHKNLPSDAKLSVETEIDNLIKRRVKRENTGAYLQGRVFK